MERVAKYIEDFDWHSRPNQLHLGALGLWLIYFILSITTPIVSSPLLKVSSTTITTLRLLIALAYLLTWQMALYAYNRLVNYSLTIEKSQESEGFRLLANSILILVSSLILATFISTINSRLNISSHHSSFLTILTNYLYVFPFLWAFWSFWKGSESLSSSVDNAIPRVWLGVLSAVLVIFTYFWLNLIFTNPLRTSTPSPKIPATYYLSDSMIVLTIVIPSFLAWLLSIGTILNLNNYSQRVKGSIYRRAIQFLNWGIWAVIAGSVFLQGLQSLGNIRLAKLGLAKLVLMICLFLGLQLLGYLFVAIGSKRLNKIETV